jgi:hypothetical protein
VVYINDVLYKYRGEMPSGTSIEIQEGTISISPSAFYSCSGLTSVTIPNSVTSIGFSAFADCSGLTSVTIGDSVTSIGGSAFSGCSGLTSVTIGNSVKSIGDEAFSNCSGLTSVTIGNSVTSINYNAFDGCSDITDVYCFAEEVPSTDGDAFKNSYVKWATLHVPAVSIKDYKRTEPWASFGAIVALTEEETGIEDIETSESNVNSAPVYNLQGMKMQDADNLPKGIYIKGGKKYLVK